MHVYCMCLGANVHVLYLHTVQLLFCQCGRHPKFFVCYCDGVASSVSISMLDAH